MKDTLRLIISTKCNLSCNYCCNNIPYFYNQFIEKKINEIPFERYKNICITGGEPLMFPDTLNQIVYGYIDFDVQNTYLYTNGILLRRYALRNALNTFKGLNIGVHSIDQLSDQELFYISGILSKETDIRFMVQKDTQVHNHLMALGLEKYLKTWEINDCDMPNEDWVRLIGEI